MAESAELGELVRAFRHAAGMTLEDLAERSGVSVRAISDMERGRSRNPQARTVMALADALRLPDDDRKLLLHAARTGRSRPAPAPLCELPPDIPDFTGRSAELATLTSALVDRDGRPAPIVISGAGGLGKTALAVRAACSTRGEFPDGRLFVDLRGSDPEPLDPYVVQFRLLRALGVDAERIPSLHTDRTQVLRRVVADRRVLLLLDNAADEAHIRRLLPGPGGSAALITSRRTLAGLEHARRVTLGPFSDADADGMLRAVVEHDSAANPAPALIRSVAQLCGNYPLALRIAGNRMLSRPGWTLETLVNRLADEESRLDHLSAGDLQIRAAFSVSYGQLEPTTRLVFRRLALVPGPDTGAALASVLTELPVHEVDRRLDDLIELGLLVSAADQRAGFHDLIRLFAREQLVAEDTREAVEAARRQMVSWLLATARVAGSWFQPNRQRSPEPSDLAMAFPDLASAQRWLEAESENWLGALRQALGTADYTAVVSTVDALQGFSSRWVNWRHWPEVFTLSTTAAEKLGDPYKSAKHGEGLAQAEAARLTDGA
ncbi:helix-turn-helix domain-containing protein [Pseudonocardia alaniniphila]|uniref:Helix-turn-helix domain-containing protein n=1 Tax=Pseudonocardia alaniniphila TaxID=75291 RepID=A0ABS9TSG2_9PSEU|nr:helix-turn-helix domain-containing protein [Pseudonocardia alaniniphila]MCH6171171.1 helix-turn-helix domain-containing protein [Pseudonocardia alaniniphila]